MQGIAVASGNPNIHNTRSDHYFGAHLLRFGKDVEGKADTNCNRIVTLGETNGFVLQKVAWASKATYGSVQHPQIIPLLKPDDKAADVVS